MGALAGSGSGSNGGGGGRTPLVDQTLNPRVAALKPSKTMALTDLARQLRESGRDIVGLAAGEPDFDTPDAIIDAGIEALRCTANPPAPRGNNLLHACGPGRGMVSRRTAEEEGYDERHGITNLLRICDFCHPMAPTSKRLKKTRI